MHETSFAFNHAADLIGLAKESISNAYIAIKNEGGIESNEAIAYDLAHSGSALSVAQSSLNYATNGDEESNLASAFLGLTFSDLAGRALGRELALGLKPGWFNPFQEFVAAHRKPSFLASLADKPGPRHLGEEFELVASTFHRFAEQRIRPFSEDVHRSNGDIPESIITGLSELGGFGLSIPERFGGYSVGGDSDHVGMVVATEELSWGSLGIGGSLITRPEILTRALLLGGTQEQCERWLPRLADATALCAVAVTEPDFGSDVASITTSATKTEGGWLIKGTKTWCTFAARAELLMLLVRTDPDRELSHRGLSAFIVEKQRADSSGFLLTQDAQAEGRQNPDGRLEGRPIDTIGYRGMHSYELSFDNWFVPEDALIGGRAGIGKGFYLQMAGFEGGRLQTAARAIGVMQAAYEAALGYAGTRIVFGKPIINYELTRMKLGIMATVIQCARQFTLEVARQMSNRDVSLEASMAKAYACRTAEWVTREAMQIHGGMGYAEEYPVSRYFLDARVLSIFEGADETLSLKVISRRLMKDAR